MKHAIITPYLKAWHAYLESNDYKDAAKELKAKGIIQPYLNNILQGAFQYGWNKRAELIID